MEYVIGAVGALVLVWMAWITMRLRSIGNTQDEAVDMINNHSQALTAISQRSIDPEDDEDDTVAMGFHNG